MDSKNERELKTAKLAHIGVVSFDLLWNLLAFLLFRLKSLWLYNIPDTHANSRGHISSNLLLICCI